MPFKPSTTQANIILLQTLLALHFCCDHNTAAEDFSSEDHHFQKQWAHLSEKQAMIGKSVTIKSGNHQPLTWVVSQVIKSAETGADVKFLERGVCGFEFGHTPWKFGPRNKSCRIDFLELLIHTPLACQLANQLLRLNDKITEANERPTGRCHCNT